MAYAVLDPADLAIDLEQVSFRGLQQPVSLLEVVVAQRFHRVVVEVDDLTLEFLGYAMLILHD